MKKLLGLVLLCAMSFAAQAQTADEIISNYLENIGGAEAWKELHSLKLSGTSSMQGMEFPITVYSKRPNLEKVEISAQGMQIVQAFDGKDAWSINPFMGSSDPTRSTAEESAEQAKRMFEDAFINYSEKGHSIELLGTEEIEGTETHKIKLTRNDGDEMIYFFDSENHVPIMIRSFMTVGPMKGQSVETYVSDYEEHGGLMMPMSMEQRMSGQTFMQGTFTGVEINPELADAEFAFPGAKADDDAEEVEVAKEKKDESKGKGQAMKEEAKGKGQAMKDESKGKGQAMKEEAKSKGQAMKDEAKGKGDAMKSGAQGEAARAENISEQGIESSAKGMSIKEEKAAARAAKKAAKAAEKEAKKAAKAAKKKAKAAANG